MALAIAKRMRKDIERGTVYITATDICGRALTVAELNARINGLENYIAFEKHDMFTGIRSARGVVDVIICNPPFHPFRRVGENPYAPRVAIDGGEDG